MACEAPVVQHLIHGIKRYHSECACSPKLPITLDILQTLCMVLSESMSAINHTMKAMMTLTFAGFLRCGEFTLAKNTQFNLAVNLTCGSVKFIPDCDHADCIILTLPTSKTDPFCKGISVVIAAAPATITCLVVVLHKILKAIPGTPTSPLFEGLEIGSMLTHDLFITCLKALLSAHGFDSSKYLGHSFRHGAVSSAAAAGYADFEIQLLRCWHSNTYKLYIDVPQDPSQILHLSN